MFGRGTTTDSRASVSRPRLATGPVLATVIAGLLFASPDAIATHATWVTADSVRLTVVVSAFAPVHSLLAWPAILFVLVVGHGPGLVSAPLALALIILTSVPPFLLARRYRGVTRFTGVDERTIEQTGSAKGVAMSRLLSIPSDVVSVAVGVTNVRLGTPALGTAAEELPRAVTGVVAGVSVEAFTTDSPMAAVRPKFVVLAAITGISMLALTAYYHYRSGSGTQENSDRKRKRENRCANSGVLF